MSIYDNENEKTIKTVREQIKRNSDIEAIRSQNENIVTQKKSSVIQILFKKPLIQLFENQSEIQSESYKYLFNYKLPKTLPSNSTIRKLDPDDSRLRLQNIDSSYFKSIEFVREINVTPVLKEIPAKIFVDKNSSGEISDNICLSESLPSFNLIPILSQISYEDDLNFIQNLGRCKIHSKTRCFRNTCPYSLNKSEKKYLTEKQYDTLNNTTKIMYAPRKPCTCSAKIVNEHQPIEDTSAECSRPLNLDGTVSQCSFREDDTFNEVLEETKTRLKILESQQEKCNECSCSPHRDANVIMEENSTITETSENTSDQTNGYYYYWNGYQNQVPFPSYLYNSNKPVKQICESTTDEQSTEDIDNKKAYVLYANECTEYYNKPYSHQDWRTLNKENQVEDNYTKNYSSHLHHVNTCPQFIDVNKSYSYISTPGEKWEIYQNDSNRSLQQVYSRFASPYAQHWAIHYNKSIVENNKSKTEAQSVQFGTSSQAMYVNDRYVWKNTCKSDDSQEIQSYNQHPPRPSHYHNYSFGGFSQQPIYEENNQHYQNPSCGTWESSYKTHNQANTAFSPQYYGAYYCNNNQSWQEHYESHMVHNEPYQQYYDQYYQQNAYQNVLNEPYRHDENYFQWKNSVVDYSAAHKDEQRCNGIVSDGEYFYDPGLATYVAPADYYNLQPTVSEIVFNEDYDAVSVLEEVNLRLIAYQVLDQIIYIIEQEKKFLNFYIQNDLHKYKDLNVIKETKHSPINIYNYKLQNKIYYCVVNNSDAFTKTLPLSPTSNLKKTNICEKLNKENDIEKNDKQKISPDYLTQLESNISDISMEQRESLQILEDIIEQIHIHNTQELTEIKIVNHEQYGDTVNIRIHENEDKTNVDCNKNDNNNDNELEVLYDQIEYSEVKIDSDKAIENNFSSNELNKKIIEKTYFYYDDTHLSKITSNGDPIESNEIKTDTDNEIEKSFSSDELNKNIIEKTYFDELNKNIIEKTYFYYGDTRISEITNNGNDIQILEQESSISVNEQSQVNSETLLQDKDSDNNDETTIISLLDKEKTYFCLNNTNEIEILEHTFSQFSLVDIEKQDHISRKCSEETVTNFKVTDDKDVVENEEIGIKEEDISVPKEIEIQRKDTCFKDVILEQLETSSTCQPDSKNEKKRISYIVGQMQHSKSFSICPKEIKYINNRISVKYDNCITITIYPKEDSSRIKESLDHAEETTTSGVCILKQYCSRGTNSNEDDVDICSQI